MWQLEHNTYGECGRMNKSVLNITTRRKNDFLKGNVSVEGLDSQISAGQVQVVLSGNPVCDDDTDVLVCPVVSAWLCAGSPTLVTSGTCWWESPRTWFWTHAQLLGVLSIHTSWWIVVRSWSSCTRWGEWWGRFQAECWSSSYLPECCSNIAVTGCILGNIIVLV